MRLVAWSFGARALGASEPFVAPGASECVGPGSVVALVASELGLQFTRDLYHRVVRGGGCLFEDWSFLLRPGLAADHLA